MILLNYIRNLKYLAPFSMIANLFMGVGLAIIFFYIFREPLPPLSRPDISVGFATWRQLPLYFGTAIYAFEGIGMVSLFNSTSSCGKEKYVLIIHYLSFFNVWIRYYRWKTA